MHLRRYKLRNSALEFFFSNGRNYLFHFPGNKHSSKERIKILKKILLQKPSQLTFATTATPIDIFTKSSLTQRWQRHEISNFEYLMALNTMSGELFYYYLY
jgi:ribosomal protein RSM22 (predicted rRNA methylase)